MNNKDSGNNELRAKEENDSCFKIIALGGEAKSNVKQSMEKIKEGNFADATELLRIADINITEARIIQQQLLAISIKSLDRSVSSILLNHAMDILITAESELSLVHFICQIMKSKKID